MSESAVGNAESNGEAAQFESATQDLVVRVNKKRGRKDGGAIASSQVIIYIYIYYHCIVN